MKKTIFTLIACATIFSAASAFKSNSIDVNSGDNSTLTIVSDKNQCTVTTTCPNGTTASCTSSTCQPCHDAIIAWLASGGCGAPAGGEK